MEATTTTTVNENGRTVVPKPVRDKLGIDGPATLELTATCEVEMDEQGRVTLPQPARENLGIDGEDATVELTVRVADE